MRRILADALTSKLANLPPRGAPLLIGVSGGPDSVALLHALVELGHRPHVCHLNHGWRGAAGEADAEFVRALADRLGLPVAIETRVVAAAEEAARQARLDFFQSVAHRTGITTLALAHTADDQVETLLLRLIRGAGVTGLAGMAGVRSFGTLTIVRPLLAVWRAEVLEYLRARRLEYREDASNANREFLRNRIRHELLPLLEREYNPAIREVLWRTAEVLRAQAEADPVAAQRQVIRQMGFHEIERLRQVAAKQFWRTDRLWPVALRGETTVPELGIRLVAGEEGERFDADRLGEGLFLRTWRAGDRFQPLGMTGEKKLQDFFVDEKVPRHERHRVPLLCTATGQIAWVVGYRIAEPFKVTATTQRVWQARAIRFPD